MNTPSKEQIAKDAAFEIMSNPHWTFSSVSARISIAIDKATVEQWKGEAENLYRLAPDLSRTEGAFWLTAWVTQVNNT